ncbi:hypothetical protein AB9P05_11175 [Roseivirga sp. BDSF3-8]|uniref:hypothetical protein n=1 Tax=Roseivirga sp. BDSF3-8 TaxID=3241598 RepID=UPI0035326E87
MKEFVVAVLLSTLTLQATAQRSMSENVEISWSPKLEERGTNTLEDIVGYDETGFYVLKRQERGAGLTFLLGSNMGMRPHYLIEHFDNDMKPTKSKMLEMKHEGNKLDMEGVLYFQDRLLLFTTYTDKDARVKQLFLEELDKKSLMVTSERIPLGEIDFEGHSKRNSGLFDYVISFNENKLFIYQSMPYDRRDYEKFAFSVFDENLNKLWSKEVTLPYSDKEFDVMRYRVDDAGNVYLLGRKFEQGRRLSRGGEANYKYHILSYRNGGTDVQEYKVGIEGKFLNDMQLAVSENSDLILAGFYSEDSPTSISGSFYMTIDDRSGEVIKQSLKAFDTGFLTENMRNRQARRVEKRVEKGKNVELPNFDLRDLIRRADGGVVLVGEQYFVTVTTTPTVNGGMRTIHHYNYHDIMVVNIDPQGNIEWAHKIPKEQTTTDDGGYFSSYALTIAGDKLYFVFNDHRDNLDAEPGRLKTFHNQRKSVVVLGVMDTNGNLEKKPLFINKEAGVLIRPKVCEQTGDYEMVVFGERGKHQRFARLRFGADGEARK